MNQYSIAEIVKKGICKRDTLLNFIKTGKIKAVDIGTQGRSYYRVTEAELDRVFGSSNEGDIQNQILQGVNDIKILLTK